MSMAETTPRGLDTHWKQPPVTLEDALGNLIPIPLELVNSWHVGLPLDNFYTPKAASYYYIDVRKSPHDTIRKIKGA